MDYKANLKNIPIGLVERNPENPRIFFRQEEMEQLFVSIKTKGLLVPISVYKDKGKFIIIDGERRWRTFLKLNYQHIPAIIQDKPTELDNLLLMFNIHGLREQWDIFTIGMKIERVMRLLEEKKGSEVTETELSDETGMSRGVIRRAKRIISLPTRFKEKLRKELEKPKREQQFSEDLFLEMESALSAVRRNYPDAVKSINVVRDVLLKKYLEETIRSVTDFRKIVKIATAHKNVGLPRSEASNALKTIFEDNHVGIDEVYRDTVGELYEDKSMVNNANTFLSKISELRPEDLEEQSLRSVLTRIRESIDRLLG
jgi:ParB family transcriptional regulator, chromosome partitioning protein